MHGIDAIALNLAVVDLGNAIDIRRRHLAPTSHHVFGDLSEGVFFFWTEDIFADDEAVAMPLG